MLEYSEKELELFRYFDYDKLAKDSSLTAPVIYRMMAEKAFELNLSGPEVESLRRCVAALNHCKVYRMTPEWDALIDFTAPSSMPKINVCCETKKDIGGGMTVTGSRSLNVIRVEQEDDGSFTAYTDHWCYQ